MGSLLASIASSLCSIRFTLRIDSLGASLTSLFPASLRTEDGCPDIQPLPQPSLATEEKAAEIFIETSKVRKRKKKVKGNVAPIIE